MSQGLRPLRVGFYGVGRFANRTHLPNLLRLPGVAVVALCDTDPQALASTTQRLPNVHLYTDGHEMLAAEELDVLYSCVPPFAHGEIERLAAERGIHLFSEKPQALEIGVARAIDEAIRASGVLSTVGFRERHRPLIQEAKRYLAGKEVVHVIFTQVRPLPPLQGEERRWYDRMALSGGAALDWGVHAVDIIRFITGQDVVTAQAFYCQRERYSLALSSSFNLLLSGGASMTMTFVLALKEGQSYDDTLVVFYEGGYLELRLYDALVANGEVIFRGQAYDPWFAADRAFIQAVQTGDRGLLLNDYHDGLYSLAPLLAGWESARRGGEAIAIDAFMRA